jgi:hypothetical protein
MYEKVKTEKYGEIKRALLKWFRHRHHRTSTLINYFKSKGQEIEMKLMIKFKPQNGCHDQFTNHSDIVHKTIRGKARKCGFVVSEYAANFQQRFLETNLDIFLIMANLK